MKLIFERLDTQCGHYVLRVQETGIPFEAVGSVNEWGRVVYAIQQKRSFRGDRIGLVRDKSGYGLRNPTIPRSWLVVPHTDIDAFKTDIVNELLATCSRPELVDARIVVIIRSPTGLAWVNPDLR